MNEYRHKSRKNGITIFVENSRNSVEDNRPDGLPDIRNVASALSFRIIVTRLLQHCEATALNPRHKE
jgi:hypothetical protein